MGPGLSSAVRLPIADFNVFSENWHSTPEQSHQDPVACSTVDTYLSQAPPFGVYGYRLALLCVTKILGWQLEARFE